MSGGSYNYFYFQLEELVEDLTKRIPYIEGEAKYLRLALVDHIKLLATALHDIEWVDSGDYGDGDEIPAIKAVLNHQSSELDQVLIEVEKIKLDLDNAINRIRR